MVQENNITIATSIAPFNLSIQKQAIDSWIYHGFKVVSINSIEEIRFLQSEFLNVHFIESKRNSADLYGKPYIFFDEFLEYFSHTKSDICGMVNSDIHFINFNTKLLELIKAESHQSIVYGSRIDIQSIANLQGDVYELGFDFFFFDKDIISSYPQQEFCLGLPWWDYWAILAPIQKGLKAKRLVTPFAYHIKHNVNWNNDYWFNLGSTLSQHLNDSTTLNEQGISNLAFSVLEIIENNSQIIFLQDEVKSRILIVYDNKDKNFSQSITYKSIVNQSYNHKNIVIGNIANLSISVDPMEFEYIFFIEEGKVLHLNFVDIMMSLINGYDACICNLRLQSQNSNVFRISRAVIEEGIVNKSHNQCIVYRTKSFFSNGIFLGNDFNDKNIYLIGQALIQTTYNEFVKKGLLQDKSNIYLYGSGGHTTQLLETVDFKNIDLKGIIDSNPTCKYIGAYPIYSFTDIQNLNIENLLISSYSYEREMYNQLALIIDKDKLIRIYYII